jgi:hypothetical protein
MTLTRKEAKAAGTANPPKWGSLDPAPALSSARRSSTVA